MNLFLKKKRKNYGIGKTIFVNLTKKIKIPKKQRKRGGAYKGREMCQDRGQCKNEIIKEKITKNHGND